MLKCFVRQISKKIALSFTNIINDVFSPLWADLRPGRFTDFSGLSTRCESQHFYNITSPSWITSADYYNMYFAIKLYNNVQNASVPPQLMQPPPMCT